MKILIIQLKRLGDLVLTAPMIAALRREHPKAVIHLAIAGGSKAIAPAIPEVDRVLVAKGNWREAFDWAVLMSGGYDCCIDLTRTDRSAALAFLSRAKRKITFERTLVKSKWRPLVYDEFIEPSVRYHHTVDHHLAFLAPLGIHQVSGPVRLQIPAAADAKASRVLSKRKVTGEFVIVHPGSARLEKFWEPERWAEVIAALQQRGFPVLLTSGIAAFEQSHLAKIKKALATPVIDLSGKISLLTLAALIGRARLLVTVDSVPTHLADAMGTPQVVLYGPTNPFHWRPRTSPAVILRAGQSQPVTEFRPHQRGQAMNEISTAQVIDAMESLLSAPTAAVS